jgi:hypothetical protein
VFLSPRFRSGGGCAPSSPFGLWRFRFVCFSLLLTGKRLQSCWRRSGALLVQSVAAWAVLQRLKHVARPDLFNLLSSNRNAPLNFSRRGLLVLLLVLTAGVMVSVRRVALTCQVSLSFWVARESYALFLLPWLGGFRWLLVVDVWWGVWEAVFFWMQLRFGCFLVCCCFNLSLAQCWIYTLMVLFLCSPVDGDL